MDITLNGEAKTVDTSTTISGLIAELGVDPTQVAVERNGEIVPKSTHEDVTLAEDDTIELVRFIGGG